jgi:hypothetical protein
VTATIGTSRSAADRTVQKSRTPDGGLVSRDSTYPVWRAGANAATTLQTGANLDVAGLNVPAGTFTLYVLVKEPRKLEAHHQ